MAKTVVLGIGLKMLITRELTENLEPEGDELQNCLESPPLVHDRRSPLADDEVVAATLKFVEQVTVFFGRGWSAFGDATEVVSRTMLAYVLVTGTKKTVIVAGQFGEEGKDAALTLPPEDNDCCIHRSCPFYEQDRPSAGEGRQNQDVGQAASTAVQSCFKSPSSHRFSH
jgi:hypothetical protein